MSQLADTIKVIAFDVFGTVVDWYGSITREVASILPDVDAEQFTSAWREGYRPAMAEVMSNNEWVILDVLYRRILDRVLEEFGQAQLPEVQRQQLNNAWRRLDPWTDSAEGLLRLKSKYVICTLSNGNIGLLTDMAKYGGLPWDCILSAENFKRYKPHPDTYLGVVRTFDLVPGEVMLAAAHHSDLEGARQCGLETAYIERPWEYGRYKAKNTSPWDRNSLHATDIADLAAQLGC